MKGSSTTRLRRYRFTSILASADRARMTVVRRVQREKESAKLALKQLPL